MEKPIVSGIALDKNQVRVGMYGVIDKPGVASAIFTALDRKSTRLNSSHLKLSRMPSSA